MIFDIAVNGRPWKVAIEPAEGIGQFSVTVNGRTRTLDASWIDVQTLSVIDEGVSREVRVQSLEAGVLHVAVDGRAFEAVVSKARRSGSDPPDARRGQTPNIVSGNGAVRAHMPGRIVRVLVAVGDRVVARQPVVIVEAMKMENELRSSGAGVVKEINVQEGAVIESGAVLLVIEYAAL